MKKILALLIFSFLFLAVKCPKPDNTKNQTPPAVLPPITQTGANTFGCLVNGRVWLPHQDHPNGSPNLESEYYKGYFTVTVLNNTDEGGAQYVTWAYKSIYRLGTYYFKSAPGGGAPGAIYSNFLTNCQYYTNDQDSLNNYVTITRLDSVNRIISGNFSLYFLPSAGGCDTIKITSGRFDNVYTY